MSIFSIFNNYTFCTQQGIHLSVHLSEKKRLQGGGGDHLPLLLWRLAVKLIQIFWGADGRVESSFS